MFIDTNNKVPRYNKKCIDKSINSLSSWLNTQKCSYRHNEMKIEFREIWTEFITNKIYKKYFN